MMTGFIVSKIDWFVDTYAFLIFSSNGSRKTIKVNK